MTFSTTDILTIPSSISLLRGIVLLLVPYYSGEHFSLELQPCLKFNVSKTELVFLLKSLLTLISLDSRTVHSAEQHLGLTVDFHLLFGLHILSIAKLWFSSLSNMQDLQLQSCPSPKCSSLSDTLLPS